jgi:hypothetical protein
VILWVWKSNCTPTIKFFAWLHLNDRLNTRNILGRRKKVLEEGYNCVLCHEGIEETSEHLFFECSLLFDGGLRWGSLGAIPVVLIRRFTWPNKPFLTPSS